MRVLCSAQINISASIDQAFISVADISKWPLWFGCIVSAQLTRNQPLALEDEVHLCLHSGRKRWHETFEVTRYVRNAFLSLEGAFSAARRIDFRFEQRGQQTRVLCSVGYPVFGGLLASVLDAAFARPGIARGLRHSLKHLRAQLEEASEHPVFASEAFFESSAAAPSGSAPDQTQTIEDVSTPSSPVEPACAVLGDKFEQPVRREREAVSLA